jgi:hypothetical protein
MIALRVLHNGRVVREAVFSTLPVTIGRGATSDIVLSDDAVSRAHARVERGADGRLKLVDLDSRNGLRVGSRPVREIALDRRLRCRIGLTEIELEPVSDAPTLEVPAREWRRFERRRMLPNRLRYLALGVAGLLASVVVEPSFWSPSNDTRWGMLLGAAVAALVMLPVLSGALFVVLKALGRQLRLSDTMRTLSLLAWLSPASDVLLLAAYYLLSPSALAQLKSATVFVFSAVSVVALASVRRHPRSIRFMLAWAGAAVLLVGGVRITSVLNARQKGEPNVDLQLQVPVAGYAGRAGTLDAYLGDVRSAARRAERAAEEVRVRGGGD